jgi:methyltransferase (TIGR00027 family)
MKENQSSRTALRVAMRRAVHQILDDPKVFHDPLALRIVGLGWARRTTPFLKRFLGQAMLSLGRRAFMVARSRYAEDELHRAVQRGVRQYVILGAGLDTFAYRNSYPKDVLRVFEVDHPATQAWKRRRLKEAGIPIPKTLTFSAINFETQNLKDGLCQAGFDACQGTFFSWLGVTQYLTSEAIAATLRFVASLPSGSGIVFDYHISPFLLNPAQRLAREGLAQRVNLADEPFQTCFDPSRLKSSLRAMGFGTVEDVGSEGLNALYFRDRSDKLIVSSPSHIMNARV